ncbi:MAG: MlaD family protein [Planctomycetota bacterium]|nr:MlaD family protein [Planctomycetota bacterium]
MKQEIIVGFIFFAALGVLFYFTVIVDDFGIDVFSDSKVVYSKYTVRFQDAGGIDSGAKVFVSGLDVGRVASLALLDTGEVEAAIKVKKKLTFHEDYSVVVRTTEIMGGRHVEIDVGDSKLPVVEPDFLVGRSEPNMSTSVSTLIAENRLNVREAIDQLRQVIERLNTGEGTIGKLMKDQALYDSLHGTIDDLRQMVSEMRSGKGTLGKIMTEDQLHEDLETVVADLKEITSDLREGKGTLGKLLKDPSLYEDLSESLAKGSKALERVDSLVAGVQAGEGTIGMLFKDDEVRLALKESVENVREVTGGLRRGEGTLGKLLVDGELYSKLLGTVDDIQVMTRDMRSGKGTLGKVMRDDALYVDLRRAVRSILHSVEDAREQAPISLFTSVLFNAF